MIVIDQGRMTEHSDIMKWIGELQHRCGVYMWLVRAPGQDTQWFPVYLGQSKNLGNRLKDYVHKCGSFGPKTEFVKYAVSILTMTCMTTLTSHVCMGTMSTYTKHDVYLYMSWHVLIRSPVWLWRLCLQVMLDLQRRGFSIQVSWLSTKIGLHVLAHTGR